MHIILPTQEELATALMRFQEFYESPFPDIRGQIFTLGYLRAKGSRTAPGLSTYEGGTHYKPDWAGYNFPSYVLDPFIRGLFDPLTSYEQDIVNTLKYNTEKFYVIGTFGDSDPLGALEHEICHGLYYTVPKYKKAVDDVLGQYNLTNLKKMLLSWGYSKEVLDDECHAYLSADWDYIHDVFSEDLKKFKVKLDRTIHTKLRKIRKRYD